MSDLYAGILRESLSVSEFVKLSPCTASAVGWPVSWVGPSFRCDAGDVSPVVVEGDMHDL